jgi:hypothetical protein
VAQDNLPICVLDQWFALFLDHDSIFRNAGRWILLVLGYRVVLVRIFLIIYIIA